MADDSKTTLMPLSSASVILRKGDRRTRVPVYSAVLAPRGRRGVRITFEGQDHFISIDLTRRDFWDLSSWFHEAAAHADFGAGVDPGQRQRRKRS